MDEAERAALDAANCERANRRARSESRRYMVANRLRYQWVLTFKDGEDGLTDRPTCMAQVARFARQFKRRFGVMPYWFSPELHPSGRGWHVNFLVPKRLPHDVMQEMWGHGIVWVSDKTKHPDVVKLNLPFIDALRLAAMYACKYASKDWDPEQVGAGRHRYECAEGFEPQRIVKHHETLAAAMESAEGVFGVRPLQVWASSESSDWDGPPCFCLYWAKPAGASSGGGGPGG